MSSEEGLSALNHQDVRGLRNRLHHLKPTIVLDCQGLTHAVFQDIDLALNEHELIKIRTHANSSKELTTIANEICSTVKAVLIQTMGYIIAIYRKTC